MDIKILNIKFNVRTIDVTWDGKTKRTFEPNGYTVEYYLNKFIKSTIEIKTDKELTIDEIKEKIKETYRGETMC